MIKILVLIPAYLPGFKSGGPVRTVSNMVDRLGNEFNFRVVASDRDLGDSVAYRTVDFRVWNKCGKAHVFYVQRGLKGAKKIFSLLKERSYDALYLNSFFSFQFSILPFLMSAILQSSKPIILAPRGEFAEGALSFKARRKRAFVACAKGGGLYKYVIWHASTVHEAADIRRVMGDDAIVRTAIDVVMTTVDFTPVHRNNNEPLRIVFISRISPVKNLLGVLAVLTRVHQEVRIDVYGPIEDEAYWMDCQVSAAKLPVNVVFKYCGELQPFEVSQTLARYDLFLFLTLGENYGHVIAEALCAGLPILISDTTPWRDLARIKLGWDIPLDQTDRFVACIEDCIEKSSDEYNGWRCDIRQWALANIGTEASVEENRQLFSNLV